MADEQSIREVHAIWIDAVNAGDLETLLSLMAEDVVFLNPGEAAFGKDRFCEGFRAGHEKFELVCRSEPHEVVVVGDLAYSVSEDSLELTSREDGANRQLSGDRLTIYRKQKDGRWLLARDEHTLK